MKRLAILIIGLSFFLLPVFSNAQNFNEMFSKKQQMMQQPNRAAQYILGSGDVLLVTVNLWGHVLKPGIYSVPSSYSLIDLISSAGGPLSTARLNDVRVVRKNQEVIKVNLEKFLKTGDASSLPTLQPGDTIIVSGSIQDVFTKMVAIFRDLAIIVNVFVLASRVNN
ncbi:polysaccharide biosynthesis/export family protein [Caldithrix abyssi]